MCNVDMYARVFVFVCVVLVIYSSDGNLRRPDDAENRKKNKANKTTKQQ